MSAAFRRDGDRIVGRLKRHEVVVLRGMVEDVQRLVAADAPASAVTKRLFPDPSFDPEAATELRGLIEDDLRAAKQEAARAMLESLPDDGKVSLDTETAELWLTALNDLRLALGTALNITEEMYGEDDSDDPSMNAYHWLSFLQETLVEAVSAGGVGR